MALVCNTAWTIKPGSEAVVVNAVLELTITSRAEPGNLVYESYIDPEAPRIVRIFKVFTDAAAFAAHERSEHFAQHALRTAVPELDHHERDFYETLDGAAHGNSAATAH